MNQLMMEKYFLAPEDNNAELLEPEQVASLILTRFPLARVNRAEAERRLSASLRQLVESGTPEIILQGHRAMIGVALIIEVPTEEGMIELYVEPYTSIIATCPWGASARELVKLAEALDYVVFVSD